MTEVVYGTAERSDIKNIQETARASWYRTYKGIFTGEFIADFLARAYSKENLLRSLNSDMAAFLVARVEGRVIGFCQFGPAIDNSHKGQIQLYRIYIHPDYWRQGIGMRLLEMMEAHLVPQGIREYFCYVHKDNDIGRSFYEKNHFIHDAKLDKDDEWFMVKQLSSRIW